MPQTIIKNGGEEELFNPENFKEGGEFDPCKDVNLLKPKKHERS
jgi:hypothetical protein